MNLRKNELTEKNYDLSLQKKTLDTSFSFALFFGYQEKIKQNNTSEKTKQKPKQVRPSAIYFKN